MSVCNRCGFGMGQLGECRFCAAKSRGRIKAKRLRLTREQQFLLSHGGKPRIAFPAAKPCPVEPGFVRKLSPKLSIEVTGVRRTKMGEWVIDYLVRDERPILMRRVPPVHTPESHDGFVPPPSKADIEIARLEGSYTRSSHGSIRDGGDAVPEVDQTLIEMRARTKWAEQKRKDNPERETERDIKAVQAEVRQLVKTAAELGVDPALVLAPIERQIRSQQEELKEAA